MHKSRWNYRIIIFIFTMIVGLALSLPSFIPSMKGPKILLGLDLQGGLHMLLGVDTKEAIKSKYKSIASSIKYFSDDNDIVIDSLRAKSDGVSFVLLDNTEEKKLDEMIKKIPGVIINKKRDKSNQRVCYQTSC